MEEMIDKELLQKNVEEFSRLQSYWNRKHDWCGNCHCKCRIEDIRGLSRHESIISAGILTESVKLPSKPPV